MACATLPCVQPTMNGGGGNVRKLTMVQVQSSNLSFGCMAGRLDGTDTPVTVKILHGRKDRVLGGWPRAGDFVACVHVVHSIYEPKVLIYKEDLHRQRMLGRLLPDDVKNAYFPIRRPLTHVEA